MLLLLILLFVGRVFGGLSLQRFQQGLETAGTRGIVVIVVVIAVIVKETRGKLAVLHGIVQDQVLTYGNHSVYSEVSRTGLVLEPVQFSSSRDYKEQRKKGMTANRQRSRTTVVYFKRSPFPNAPLLQTRALVGRGLLGY